MRREPKKIDVLSLYKPALESRNGFRFSSLSGSAMAVAVTLATAAALLLAAAVFFFLA